jgi:hypothetical protein
MFSMPSVQIAQRWKVLLNEEWLKKIWKPIGLFTCVLAATSLPLPNSISRKILGVYMQKGGFEPSNFFGLLFFVSLFAALGTHSAVFVAQEFLRRLGEIHSRLMLWVYLFLNLALSPVFIAFGILFLLMLGSFDPEVRNAVEIAFNYRVPNLPEIKSISLLVLRKTTPFGFVMVPMALANMVATIWAVSAITLRHSRDYYRVTFRAVRHVLKAIRHLDFAFQWFNRKFDIEKKPLSAIGLVAGSLVAILYWSWAVFRHFVSA